MTEKQALTEARKRWGKNAQVEQRARGKLTHTVGRVFGGLAFMVEGQGTNWAEAFENADKKKERLS